MDTIEIAAATELLMACFMSCGFKVSLYNTLTSYIYFFNACQVTKLEVQNITLII